MKFYGDIRWASPEQMQRGLHVYVPKPVWAIRATPNVMMRLKRLFARVQATRTGIIWIGDTPEVAYDLRWAMDRWPLRMDEASRARLEQRADQYTEAQETVERILNGDTLQREFREPAREPRDYQVQAADVALATGRLLLTDQLGLGKSFSGLLLLRDPEALPALVVTLTHLPDQWLSELNVSFPWLSGHVVRKGKPYDPLELRGIDRRPDVLIMNYSKLAGWADHLAGEVRTVIFDEIQELRREASQKYVAAGMIADQAVYKMGLTATPVYNYGGEIFNIISVLDRDALGTRDEFSREWGMGWKGKLTDANVLGTYLREQGLMLRRTRKQVGRELPEVVRVPHEIPSDEDVMDRLTGDALDMAEMILNRTGTKEEVWRASGDFDWKMRQATGIAKAPYVADFVKMLLESGEKVVLFGWHHAVYDIWKERLADYGPLLFTGKETPLQKRRAQREFIEGNAQVLIMSLRAGAGLDGLQDVCHVAVFGELDWSPGMHDQCIGRFHRDGQDESVLAYFLVSDQGADPVMAEVLNLKRMQAEAIVEPSAGSVEAAPSAHDRVRRLAADVLERRRQREAS